MTMRFLLVFASLVAFVLAACVSQTLERSDSPADLSPGVGHGAFFRADGSTFVPDRDYILRAQAVLIGAAQAGVGKTSATYPQPVVQADAIEALIRDAVPDRALGNALFIDWLLERQRHASLVEARQRSLNEALRRHYIAVLQKRPLRQPGERLWNKGIERSAALRLEDAGVTVAVPTAALSTQYAADCRERGVPVPDTVLLPQSQWQRLGTYANPLSNIGGEPELWVHYDKAPRGVCLALTHVAGSNNHLDLICLGTPSDPDAKNRACFFEGDLAFDPSVGFEPVTTTDLLGARAPNLVTGGVCSDCHAGENPFIVHPDKPAFAALDRSRIMPREWHAPFVDSSWPQNPGPSHLLDDVASTGQCTACHTQAYAGRFPKLSTDLSQYCMLLNRIVGPLPTRTMPAEGASFVAAHYQNHVAALQRACGMAPGFDGKIVDFPVADDPTRLSPPRVNGPLYACAAQPSPPDSPTVFGDGSASDPDARLVSVSGVVLDAELRLFVNGVLSRSVVGVRDPDLFELLVVLAPGDVVTADQRVGGGAFSARSAKVTVRSPAEDFPQGLSRPVIMPTTVHACASLIGVRHVPGADISVTVNGGQRFTAPTSGGWTVLPPTKAPFEIDDAFVAQAALCGMQSDPSAAVRTVMAPARLDVPAMVPARAFDGQALLAVTNLTHGASAAVAELTTGAVAGFSTPVRSKRPVHMAGPLGRSLRDGDSLRLSQSLCTASAATDALAVQPCSALPPPLIEGPSAGQRVVIVAEAVPGARVRVWDNASPSHELGDGSGGVIGLNRALAGNEVVTVNQQVGACVSQQGYQVTVRAAP